MLLAKTGVSKPPSLISSFAGVSVTSSIKTVRVAALRVHANELDGVHSGRDREIRRSRKDDNVVPTGVIKP